MSEGRFTVLPDLRLSALRGIVATRLEEIAHELADGAFDEFFDGTMRGAFLEGLTQAGAHEGTVWLLDPKQNWLVPRFNNGPNAASFVGHFRQSLQVGMISMVVATEQPICENEVHKNAQQDPTLDRKLGLATCSMLAVPLYVAGELRGVVSAVRLKPATPATPDPAGFSPRDLRALQLTADVLERLIEHELLTRSFGLGTGAW
ncbi:MAG: GAF domain-containing protein [Chthoniobacteraceae bacterium]